MSRSSDPAVAITMIWIDEPGRVFVARHGRSELTTPILDEGQVGDLVEKMLKSTGRRIDINSLFAQPCQHAQARYAATSHRAG